MIENLAFYYYNAGLSLAQEKYITSATKELKKAVSLYHSCIPAWNLLGLCYYRLGNFEAARHCWDESLTVNPVSNEANRYLYKLNHLLEIFSPLASEIQQLAEKKHYKIASRRWEKDILNRFDPAVELFNYGGILKILSGKKDAAIMLWKKSLELDKSNKLAANYIIKSTDKTGFIPKLLKRIKK